LTTGEPSEGTFDEMFELGDQKPETDQSKDSRAKPEQEILGKVQQRENLGPDEDLHAETHSQTENDGDRSAPIASTRCGDISIRRAGHEDDGEDGHDAR
jgi:hypothetical protein